jgi:iron complex outermembrane receptor protein
MKTRRLALLLVSTAVLAPAFAQSTPPASSSSGTAGEVVQLPVFEVSAERDRGYSSRDAVGATRINIPLIEIAQAIAVANEKQMRDVAPNSISEVAKYIGGVTETSSPGRDIFVIRGVQISAPFTDGLPESGSSQGSGLDMNMFNRVEVLKGPTAVIYGSTAPGGVVNRVMKKPQFDRPRLTVDLEAGSYAHYRATVDANQPFGPGRNVAVRFVGSYWSKEGQQDFVYKHRRFLAPMFGWRLTPSTTATLTVTDLYDRYHKGWGQAFTLPPYVGNNLTLSLGLGLPRERAYAEPYSVQYEQGRRYSFLLDQKVSGNWVVRVSGVTSHYAYTESPTTILRDILIQNGRYMMQRSWRYSANPTDATTLAVDSAWKFSLGPTRHSVIALVQYQKTENEVIQYLGRGPTGSTTNVLPLLDILAPVYGGLPTTTYLGASTESSGTSLGYAVQEQAYLFKDTLILQAALRHNRNTSSGLNRLTNISDRPPAKTKWTPRFGVVYRALDGVAVYASRSETFTPVFTANPDGRTFTPPTSEQDEIGAKFDLWKGKVSATVSYYERSDRNTLVLDPDPIRASAGYRIQTAGDEMTGYEIDLYINPVAGLQLVLGGSKMDAKNLSGLLTRDVPKNQFSALAKYDFEHGPAKGLGFGLGYISRGRRPGDTGNTFWLPSYEMFDAFASYTWRKYAFHLKVDNLTDKYYAHAATNRNIINLGPPRAFILRVSREF